MNWIWAALMPHPPILVAQVGKGREQEAAPSLHGVAALCERLSRLPDHTPDCLVVLSPHQPYVPGALYLNTANTFNGSLVRFGAPQAALELAAPAEARNALAAHLAENGIPIQGGAMEDITPDHGSIVPLTLLAPVFGKAYPAVILASPIGLNRQTALKLGNALASFNGSGRWALLASGDLSHRLKPGGPNGFNPAGQVFDTTVVRALQAGDPGPILELPEKTVEGAGECGMRSVLALLGLCRAPLEVFSYEGPFGVGYCNALWVPGAAHGQQPSPSESDETHASHATETDARTGLYPVLARWVVTQTLKGQQVASPPPALAVVPGDPLWNTKKACFVSIKTKDGALRGCIGTILPVRPSLDQEIRSNALAAAMKDPRFPPMTAEELDKVVFSVDVLTIPEPVTDIKDLDPKIWGVIVTKGNRRGLLLPDLDGVDTVEKQLAIAAQKGGITDLNGAQIQRFRVNRYKED